MPISLNQSDARVERKSNRLCIHLSAQGCDNPAKTAPTCFLRKVAPAARAMIRGAKICKIRPAALGST